MKRINWIEMHERTNRLAEKWWMCVCVVCMDGWMNEWDVWIYHEKNGNQHTMNVPIIIPNVRAALCSRFIFIKCLSFVGVLWSWSTSFNVNILDEPDPLNASPAKTHTHKRNRYSNESTSFWVDKFKLPFVPPALEWRCMSMAFPCRIINCFSWRFASRKMAKYVNIIIVHGIQNDIELDITAYTLFTSNSQTSGCVAMNSLCASVVYQPAKMGMNDNSAGDTHVFNIIIATTFFVMVMGYFNGFTIA